MAITESAAGFRLSKWYLDVVTEEGAAFIGYAARLHWGRLRLNYAGELWSEDGAPTRAHWSVRPGDPPLLSRGVVAWNCMMAGEEGRWRVRDTGYARRLFESPEGCVDWSCITPRADVTLHTPGGCVQGTGYVERVHLTIAPWKLGLDTLYWGRFHAPGHTVTWIEWAGRTPVRLAWHNGVLDAAASVVDDTLLLPAQRAELRLEPARARTIRDAPVLGTVLEALPLLAPLTPDVFRAHEHKVVGPAELQLEDDTRIAGTALYEVVTW